MHQPWEFLVVTNILFAGSLLGVDFNAATLKYIVVIFMHQVIHRLNYSSKTMELAVGGETTYIVPVRLHSSLRIRTRRLLVLTTPMGSLLLYLSPTAVYDRVGWI